MQRMRLPVEFPAEAALPVGHSNLYNTGNWKSLNKSRIDNKKQRRTLSSGVLRLVDW
jgi:hypothetical protein